MGDESEIPRFVDFRLDVSLRGLYLSDRASFPRVPSTVSSTILVTISKSVKSKNVFFSTFQASLPHP